MSAVTVIHTHFHKRRTGVTRSVENVIPFLKELCTTYVYGYGINEDTIDKKQLKETLFSKDNVVVHCHRNNEVLKMLWYKLLGAKFTLIATRHAETSPSGLTRFLLKKSDKVVTLTEAMHKSLGINNTKVPHGVDITLFRTGKAELKDVLQENIILCAGRVRKAKGQVTLLKASVGVLKANTNWALVIVGKIDKDEFRRELQQIVAEHELGNQVYFVDETNDIISYYQAASLAVTPSFTEGFSLVCAEAMACGKTVIATKNVGIHSELISNNKSGYLFEAGNEEALANLIKAFVAKDIIDVGDEARNEIVANWSAKLEAENLYKLYAST